MMGRSGKTRAWLFAQVARVMPCVLVVTILCYDNEIWEMLNERAMRILTRPPNLLRYFHVTQLCNIGMTVLPKKEANSFS